MVFLMAAVASVEMTAATAQPATRESVSQDFTSPELKVSGSVIELYCGDSTNVKFEIFSITGLLVKQVTLASGSMRIELPKGFYIVKCESWTRRVMLK